MTFPASLSPQDCSSFRTGLNSIHFLLDMRRPSCPETSEPSSKRMGHRAIRRAGLNPRVQRRSTGWLPLLLVYFWILLSLSYKLYSVCSSVLHISDPHYWQILYLQIHLFTRIYLQPPNQYLRHFHGHSFSGTSSEGQKFWVPAVHAPSWGRTDVGLPACFSAHTKRSVCFEVFLVPVFLTLVFFVGDFVV